MGYRLGEPTVQQFFDANGDPLAGGTIEFYETGTSNPTAVYQDDSGTSAGTSVTLNTIGAPVNGGGTPIALFFDEDVVYRIIRKDASGTPIPPTIDPYYGDGAIDAIPRSGTVSGQEVTGRVTWIDSVNGRTYSIGEEEDFHASLSIRAEETTDEGSISIKAWDGAGPDPYWWTFRFDGDLVLPLNVDYDLVSDASAVPKGWIENLIGGGVPANTYLELAGTDPSYPITGDVEFAISGTDVEVDTNGVTTPAVRFAPPTDQASYIEIAATEAIGVRNIAITPSANNTGVSFIAKSSGGSSYLLELGLTGNLAFRGNTIATASGVEAIRLTGNQTGIAGDKTVTGAWTFQNVSPGVFMVNLTCTGFCSVGSLTTTAAGIQAQTSIRALTTLRSDNLGGSGTINVDCDNSGILIKGTSDERLKNVLGSSPYGLAEIVGLYEDGATIRYTWRDTESRGEQEEIGFSAQRTTNWIPEAAPLNVEEDVYGFNDRPLIAALVNAVAELKDEVDMLRRELLG